MRFSYMRKKRIGIKYCGGCNPQIDRSKMAKDIKEGLEKQGIEFFPHTDSPLAFDVLLLINGCRSACSEEDYLKTDHNVQMISVKDEMVDDLCMEETTIPGFVIGKIMSLRTKGD